jgi:predicted N-formylglutamate amidohydrolase
MATPSFHKFIITCEHASNNIPEEFAYLFEGALNILNSHRGWDPGASKVAHAIKEALNTPLFEFPFSRLLIEPNRSSHHPQLFSEFPNRLSATEKAHLLNIYYFPYRRSVEREIESILLEKQSAIHIGIHSFTPILNDKERLIDIGLLYDPSSLLEKEFCKKWKASILDVDPTLRVRMNQPYKGTSDGFTTTLRQKFGASYAGIELEVNQAHFTGNKESESKIINTITTSLLHVQ